MYGDWVDVVIGQVEEGLDGAGGDGAEVSAQPPISGASAGGVEERGDQTLLAQHGDVHGVGQPHARDVQLLVEGQREPLHRQLPNVPLVVVDRCSLTWLNAATNVQLDAADLRLRVHAMVVTTISEGPGTLQEVGHAASEGSQSNVHPHSSAGACESGECVFEWRAEVVAGCTSDVHCAVGCKGGDQVGASELPVVVIP